MNQLGLLITVPLDLSGGTSAKAAEAARNSRVGTSANAAEVARNSRLFVTPMALAFRSQTLKDRIWSTDIRAKFTVRLDEGHLESWPLCLKMMLGTIQPDNYDDYTGLGTSKTDCNRPCDRQVLQERPEKEVAYA